MRFGSLFSGIGGLDLGLERAGMTCEWQVEIDDYCRKVLEKHWPHVARFKDIRECSGVVPNSESKQDRRIQQPRISADIGASGTRRGTYNLSQVDLICGGFPCQPVSVAGRRKGQEDSRWLWPEFARIVSEVQPRWVLVENVPGLLSRGMGDVLRDLSALGYDAEWDSIPAAAVGAPHLRYRVFVVAYATGTAHERLDGARAISPSDWWETEPDMGRVADGVPSRVDRLRGLGNAVVPQVAEWVGRRIVEAA